MVTKQLVQKTLNKLNLSQLRQLSAEFNLSTVNSKSKASKAQLIAGLINPSQKLSRKLVGGANPVIETETETEIKPDYPEIGNQLEAYLSRYIGDEEEPVIPVEQVKAELKEAEINYDYSAKDWFKILLNSKILLKPQPQFDFLKAQPPFQALPYFVQTLKVLPELSYGELKLLKDYYPESLGIRQAGLEDKRKVELKDLSQWSPLKGRSVDELSQLKELNLRQIQLESLPESIGALSQLKLLELSQTPLRSLPESIGALSQLKHLGLQGTKLGSLPESIGALSQLKSLGLSETPLRSLPESIGALSPLEELYLGGAELESLPESIGALSKLEWLGLSETPLRSLPESIGALSQLEWLSLSRTKLRSLPESIGALSQLKYLGLSQTQLESLPESIGNLSKLKSLGLHRTELGSLPIVQELRDRGVVVYT